jgi:hypothetical protein
MNRLRRIDQAVVKDNNGQRRSDCKRAAELRAVLEAE